MDAVKPLLHGPFNSPVETGLRSLVLLNEAHPNEYSLQSLVVHDYLLVHSDDIPDGPDGLHPKTPFRSGELLVRRNLLQKGLDLYRSRGLIQRSFKRSGLFYSATDFSDSFLESLSSDYVVGLRATAIWEVNQFGHRTETELLNFANEHLGDWGAEFDIQNSSLNGDT